jgi:hypothetical protein
MRDERDARLAFFAGIISCDEVSDFLDVGRIKLCQVVS